MVAKRKAKDQVRRPVQGESLPPAAGATWGDDEEFQRFWGKSPDEIRDEFRREDAAVPPRRVLSEEEFLASLEERP